MTDSSLLYTFFVAEKEAKCFIPQLIWPFPFHSWVLAPPDQGGASTLTSYTPTQSFRGFLTNPTTTAVWKGLTSNACFHNPDMTLCTWTCFNGVSVSRFFFSRIFHQRLTRASMIPDFSGVIIFLLFLIKCYTKSPRLVPALLWLTLWGTIPGPTISNKQRIQRWITVGIKSIAAGLPGTAIDYESVLVSRTPRWRKEIRRQEECIERGKQREKHPVVAINWHSCHVMLNIRYFRSHSCKLNTK